MRNSVAVYFIFTFSFFVAAQTGGTYDLSHNVIASGGGSQSTGGQFTVDGTVGQNLAGTYSTNGAYGLRGGFWAFQQAAPTAALVTVSGRVFLSGAVGMSKIRIVITDVQSGVSYFVRPNPFGYFRFQQVEVGRFYVITPSGSRLVFTPQSRDLMLLEEVADADFTGHRF